MKMILFYILITLSAIFIAFCIWTYIIFLRVCRRKNKRSQNFEKVFSPVKLERAGVGRLRTEYEWIDSSATEEISVLTFDGLKLCARVFRAEKARGTIILFHGFRSFGRRDFCLHLRTLFESGYNIILVDQRSHGKSEGKYVCYGVKERRDALVWAKKAAELFGEDTPVCLMGLSLGGATVLMSSELVCNLPYVRCIVADCPFSSPWGIVRHVLKNKHNAPLFPLVHFINLWCRLIAKFNLKETSAAEAVARSTLPVLIIHGAADDYVPVDCSRKVVNASPEQAQLILIDGAEHAEAIFFDEKKYLSTLFDFLDKNM